MCGRPVIIRLSLFLLSQHFLYLCERRINSLHHFEIVAGLPQARNMLGTEPHTHRIWSTSFRLVVMWLTERMYVHASTNCMGGVGETIKRKGGVSGVSWQVSFILDIHNMVNWQVSKQDSHWPVSHDHIAGSCVNSSKWRYFFGSCPLTS